MDLKIFDSTTRFNPSFPLPIYFSKGYLGVQNHQKLIIAESDHFLIPINLEGRIAKSIDKSPFGSFLVKDDYSPEDLSVFHEGVQKLLKARGVETFQIKHPSPIYTNCLNQEKLLKLGYNVLFEDINQHIPLDDNWRDNIHAMQKRKLQSLAKEGFTFQVMNDFEVAHRFIEVCRQTQGLRVNIEWDHLKTLMGQLPGKYECFAVKRAEKLSAVCIAVNVSQDIAYYYLPATSPLFRSQSPMVLLIAGMVAYYRSKGYRHLDLGVSSVEGKAQETLFVFKERMGALTTKKSFLELSL